MKLIMYSADLSKELALTFADGGIRAYFFMIKKLKVKYK